MPLLVHVNVEIPRYVYTVGKLSAIAPSDPAYEPKYTRSLANVRILILNLLTIVGKRPIYEWVCTLY